MNLKMLGYIKSAINMIKGLNQTQNINWKKPRSIDLNAKLRTVLKFQLLLATDRAFQQMIWDYSVWRLHSVYTIVIYALQEKTEKPAIHGNDIYQFWTYIYNWYWAYFSHFHSVVLQRCCKSCEWSIMIYTNLTIQILALYKSTAGKTHNKVRHKGMSWSWFYKSVYKCV